MARYSHCDFLAAAAVTISAALFSGSAAADGSDTNVIGRWKLTAVLDFADLASMDEKQARRLLGKSFVIDKRGFSFGKEKCGAATFVSTWVEPNLYLREDAWASAEKLGLPNPAEVIDLTCTIVLVKSKDRLVLHWDGFFFDAVRQRK